MVDPFVLKDARIARLRPIDEWCILARTRGNTRSTAVVRRIVRGDDVAASARGRAASAWYANGLDLFVGVAGHPAYGRYSKHGFGAERRVAHHKVICGGS